MADSPTGPNPENDADHAAADWLLEDDAKPAKDPNPVIAPGGESFDLADAPEPTRRAYIPPPAAEEEIEVEHPRAARGAERARPAKTPPRERRETREGGRRNDAGAVDPVWTRGAEWGASLLVLAVWAAAVCFVVYLCLASESYAAAFLALASGAAIGTALLYPILVTLERPVRMTPEQALRDYYGALSHHLPHYKRMWLLLSNKGRSSSEFSDYEAFKRYWKKTLKSLREQGRVKGSVPLAFTVSEFKSEKSAGKSVIDASWTIQVFVRNKREDGPITSAPAVSTLVKGPDGMWYLDEGRLVVQAPRRRTRTEL